MAEPGGRARGNAAVSAAATNLRADRTRTYLVAQELHLALGQLFALVQLLDPLVKFFQGRFIVHNTNVKRRKTRINRPFFSG